MVAMSVVMVVVMLGSRNHQLTIVPRTFLPLLLRHCDARGPDKNSSVELPTRLILLTSLFFSQSPGRPGNDTGR